MIRKLSKIVGWKQSQEWFFKSFRKSLCKVEEILSSYC